MRILLVSQYFHPENFKSNDMAFELARRGYDVTVLTGLPNYPGGKIYDGYGMFRRRVETVNGVKIIRVFVVPRGRGGGLRLALNYYSYVLTASVRAFFLAMHRRFDAVIVHETSPITQGYPALIVRKMQSIPLYFWVLDLWPESLESAGGIHNKRVLDYFARVTRRMYDNSHRILISSKGFRSSIVAKGDYGSRIEYFPNWAEDMFAAGRSVKRPDCLPQEGFIVMFAGNIGEAQDFESVMNAALLLRDEDVKLVLVGDGRRKEYVDRFIAEHELENTVFALGRHPLESMPAFFAAADVMMLSLKDEPIFSLTVPAKLQSYMAAGKPVVVMASGEARRLVAEAECGLSVNAGDAEGLAEIIRKMRQMPRAELDKMGQNGFCYYKENFTLDKCMDHLCQMLIDGEKDRLHRKRNNS